MDGLNEGIRGVQSLYLSVYRDLSAPLDPFSSWLELSFFLSQARLETWKHFSILLPTSFSRTICLMSLCSQVLLFLCWLQRPFWAEDQVEGLPDPPALILRVLPLKEALACSLPNLAWLEAGKLNAHSEGPLGFSMCCLLMARGSPPWCCHESLWDGALEEGHSFHCPSSCWVRKCFLYHPRDREMDFLLQPPVAHCLKLWVPEGSQLSSPLHHVHALPGAGEEGWVRTIMCRSICYTRACRLQSLTSVSEDVLEREKNLTFSSICNRFDTLYPGPHLRFTTTPWGTVAQRD